MKLLHAVATLLISAIARGVPLSEAIKAPNVGCTISGDGRSQMVVEIRNASTATLTVEVPAGAVGVGRSGARMMTIRKATLQMDPGETGEGVVPAVPLSPGNGVAKEVFTVTSDKVPELQPLIEYSEAHSDLPRGTAQMIALLLQGNATYAQWVSFLRHDTTAETRPTPADIAAAVDGLAIARQLQPSREFALYGDSEFRLRAVRNPWSRAKAMQLFAMTLPEGVVAPDIGQLLHSKAGDNCPICRLRGKAEEQAGNGL